MERYISASYSCGYCALRGFFAGCSMNLKQLRHKAGLTQLELADRCGFSRVFIWQLETGKRKGDSLTTLKKLAAALGVSLGELVE